VLGDEPISSAAAQRFDDGNVVTYAQVLHGPVMKVASADAQATHERRKCFDGRRVFPLRAGCHAVVAKTPSHGLCCTGVMSCRWLKFAVHKGGLGMTRGVSF